MSKKTPEQILASLTDEQREMVLSGYKRIAHPTRETRAPWTRLARKGLFESQTDTEGSGFSGRYRVAYYRLTNAGKQVRVLIVAEKGVELAVLKESLGMVTIPMWLLMMLADRGDHDKIATLICRSGQGDQHDELSDLAMSIARGET